MTFRSDPPVTGRAFVFTQGAGNNTYQGTSDEVPLADPYEAIARINALDPPVTSTNRAEMRGSGTFPDQVSVPQYVAGRIVDSSIISFATTANLVLGGDQTAEIGSLLSFAANSTLVESDANSRVRCIVNAAVTSGDNSTGFVVSGISDDSSYVLTQGELRGAGDVMFHHTATATTPIVYDVGVVEFFNINQTLIKHDPANPSDQTVVNISVCQPDSLSTTTGSCVLDAMNGALTVVADDLDGEFLAKVRSGGELRLKANSCKGKTLIFDGGQAVYKSVAIHDGDIETQGTGQMLADIAQVTGNIDIGLGSTLALTSDLITGDITVNGRFDGVILNHVGILTNNGEINGIINGIPYGNWWHDYEYVESLALESTVNDYDIDPVTKMDDDIILQGGLYEATTCFDVCTSVTNRQAVVGWFINDVLIDTELVKESKDPTDMLYAAKILPINLPAGTNNVKVKYGTRGGGGVAEACLSNVRVIFNRKG
jgi:hypothetical protein